MPALVVEHHAPREIQCDIVVRGSVKSSWLDQMSDLTLSDLHTPAGVVCRLHGNVTDQAALMGVLNGLDGLGLALLSVSCRTIETLPAE